MAVYNIPLGQPFLKQLATGIIKRFSGNPIEMGQVVVLMSTRRGCLSLKEIFCEQGKKNSLILPKIYALADLEQEPILPGLIPCLTEKKVISKWQRIGYLTKLVQQFLQQKNLCHNVSTAYPLAQELATLLDEFYISDVDLRKLETIVEDDDFSVFWQQNLAFLKIISQHWPAILREKGLVEAAQFQQQNLRFIAKNWKVKTPIILAGTTGTRPATAELARAILELPRGTVVLPGFEPDYCEDIGLTHPNYTLGQFVKYLKVVPSSIEDWIESDDSINSKMQILKQAMAPYLLPTAQLPPLSGSASEITMISCANPDEEAMVIATIFRSVYEQDTGTIALITPSQSLTARVQTYLKRWDIEANVPAGALLNETVVGNFLMLISRINPEMRMIDWLALLKHPLFFKHKDRVIYSLQVRQFELDILRKRRGFKLTDKVPEPLSAWYEEILSLIKPLLDSQKNCFDYWFKLHIKVAVDLAGEEQLWASDDGEAANQFFEELQKESPDFPPLSMQDYATLIGQLISQVSVHHKELIGSPLNILGTLEGRQIEADIVILGGLNEKVWPQALDEGPWLSNQMRLKLGLAPIQRRTGLSAHDFYTNFSASEIYLTRSERQDGSLTVPSRLFLRVQTVLQQYEVYSTTKAEEIKSIVRQLDQPKAISSALPPQPKVPLHLKPKQYSVTDIEKLLRDPYGIYAKKILKLKKLDSLDQPLSARELGLLIHKIMEQAFHRNHPNRRKEFIEAMREIGRKLFGTYITDIIVRTFWWYRFEQICDWMGQNLGEIKEVLTEVRGQIEVDIADEKIMITTIADRIDKLGDGSYQLIDYKTGPLPTRKDINAGFAPQLALIGIIFQQGGFAKVVDKNSMLKEAAYWQLKGGIEGGEIKSLKDYPKILQEATDGLNALLSYFHSEEAVYLSIPWGKEKVPFNDYRQLARIDEWS